ncbi:MAG: peptidoglycan-binding protein [Acetobacteraceae bacterium]
MSRNKSDVQEFLARLKTDPKVVRVTRGRQQSLRRPDVVYDVNNLDDAVRVYEERKASGRPKAPPLLRAGHEGEEVARLQNALQMRGSIKLTVDGKFGAETEAAVRRFQQASKLPADGIAGPQTLRALGLD